MRGYPSPSPTCSLLFVICAAAAADNTPPNIIFHLVDDWGSYDASFRMRQLGRPVDIPTPTIDALHDAGVGFENYYVQLYFPIAP